MFKIWNSERASSLSKALLESPRLINRIYIENRLKSVVDAVNQDRDLMIQKLILIK